MPKREIEVLQHVTYKVVHKAFVITGTRKTASAKFRDNNVNIFEFRTGPTPHIEIPVSQEKIIGVVLADFLQESATIKNCLMADIPC